MGVEIAKKGCRTGSLRVHGSLMSSSAGWAAALGGFYSWELAAGGGQPGCADLISPEGISLGSPHAIGTREVIQATILGVFIGDCFHVGARCGVIVRCSSRYIRYGRSSCETYRPR